MLGFGLLWAVAAAVFDDGGDAAAVVFAAAFEFGAAAAVGLLVSFAGTADIVEAKNLVKAPSKLGRLLGCKGTDFPFHTLAAGNHPARSLESEHCSREKIQEQSKEETD